MKKTKYLFLFSLLIALVFPANYTYADSYTEHLINLRSAGVVEAQSLASQIDNSELSVKAINNPQSDISGVGILSNTRTKTYGSAFVIDNHTILTNNHVVESSFGTQENTKYKPENVENLKFYPSRVGNNIPFTFTIKDIKMIKGSDVAILHTNEKLTDKVSKLKLASEQSINSLKYKDKLTSYGYPTKQYLGENFVNDDKYKMYESHGFYLMNANN